MTYRKNTLTLSLLLCCISNCSIANAITPSAEDADSVATGHDSYLEEVVVTATRTPKRLKDVPVLTRVISAQEIVNAQASDVSDLLRNEMPGLEFSYTMNQQKSVNVQGFSGNGILFLVDGERLAGETLDNVDYSRLNLDNIERIEIIKGAASSLYGSNAVGGVINLISKKATDPFHVDLTARYGSHNQQYYSGVLSSAYRHINNVAQFSYDATGEIKLTRPGDFSKIYGYHAINAKDRFIYKVNSDLSFTARASYFFRQRNNSAEDKERYKDYTGGLMAQYSINDNSGLELSYSYDQYDKSDYNALQKSDIRDYSNRQHIARATYNLTLNSVNTLTAGAEYLNDYLMSYQFNGDSHKQSTYSAFAQFDYNPLSCLSIVPGVRLDHYSLIKRQHVSPKLSVLYKHNLWSFRFNYAGGFKAPSLKEMYMDFDMAGIFYIYGNENLKPETSQNFSLSAEYRKSGYNASAIVFHNIVTNRISYAWSQDLNGQLYMNMPHVTVSGAEVNFSANFGAGFSGKAAYAYTYEHLSKSTPNISPARPHTLTAQVAYSLSPSKSYALNATLSGRYLSAVTGDVVQLTATSPQFSQRYPGYAICRLTVTQRFLSRYTLSLTADNLLNYIPSYYDYNSPFTTGTTFTAAISASF